jgi:hypothetical protein
MARHGGEQHGDEKKSAKQDAGFGGESNELGAGGHENSPHLIIRLPWPRCFKTKYRRCSGKNWPLVQEVNEVKEAKGVKRVKQVKQVKQIRKRSHGVED